mmetsp:Transcript_59236/g.183981  ORF Transcript_59236/g.183981 Transcript_59236/m.183981 type:complete len:192 (-) Transcript_59236:45-620(-)
MLFPFPMFQASSGPPSQFLLDMRKWLGVMLALQSVVCILQFALADIWGGFISAIIIGFGWYGWYQTMSMTFVCYWGIMGLIHGVFGLVKLIDYQVKSRYPLFSQRASLSYNLHQAVNLFEPILMLLGALLAWYLYKYDVPDPVYDRINNDSDWSAGNRRATAGPPAMSTGGGRGLGRSFSTFGGEGHRLGS